MAVGHESLENVRSNSEVSKDMIYVSHGRLLMKASSIDLKIQACLTP